MINQRFFNLQICAATQICSFMAACMSSVRNEILHKENSNTDLFVNIVPCILQAVKKGMVISMEDFRKRLQRRKTGFMCMAFLAVIVGIIDVFYLVPSDHNKDFTNGMTSGVSTGTIVALGMLAVLQVIHISRILKDEKSLTLLYNKENDERLKLIRSKAGMPMLLIMSIAMFVAGIIGSYYSDIIFYTLFAAGMVQLSVGAIVKLTCLKLM